MDNLKMSQQTEKRGGFLTLPIIRDILIIVFIGIFAYKLVNSDLKIDLSTFSFTDLLALLLSLFSIWLSFAFYFKANDASAKFYDNSYKFTKETSELLGRIEAGFGERLKNIDEGYHGLRERFDRFSQPLSLDQKVEQKQKQQEIDEKEAELKAIINDLATKAQLVDQEKLDLLTKLAVTQSELQNARAALINNTRRSNTKNATKDDGLPLGHITRLIIKQFGEGSREISPPEIQEAFEQVLPLISPDAIDDLLDLDLATDDLRLKNRAVSEIYKRLQTR